MWLTDWPNFLSATSPEVDGKVAPETTNSLPAGLGNPPPLLSIPVGSVPQLSEHQASSTGIAKPAHGHQMSVPGYLFIGLLINKWYIIHNIYTRLTMCWKCPGNEDDLEGKHNAKFN